MIQMGQLCCNFVESINKNVKKRAKRLFFLGQAMALLIAKYEALLFGEFAKYTAHWLKMILDSGYPITETA